MTASLSYSLLDSSKNCQEAEYSIKSTESIWSALLKTLTKSEEEEEIDSILLLKCLDDLIKEDQIDESRSCKKENKLKSREAKRYKFDDKDNKVSGEATKRRRILINLLPFFINALPITLWFDSPSLKSTEPQTPTISNSLSSQRVLSFIHQLVAEDIASSQALVKAFGNFITLNNRKLKGKDAKISKESSSISNFSVEAIILVILAAHRNAKQITNSMRKLLFGLISNEFLSERSNFSFSPRMNQSLWLQAYNEIIDERVRFDLFSYLIIIPLLTLSSQDKLATVNNNDDFKILVEGHFREVGSLENKSSLESITCVLIFEAFDKKLSSKLLNEIIQHCFRNLKAIRKSKQKTFKKIENLFTERVKNDGSNSGLETIFTSAIILQTLLCCLKRNKTSQVAEHADEEHDELIWKDFSDYKLLYFKDLKIDSEARTICIDLLISWLNRNIRYLVCSAEIIFEKVIFPQLNENELQLLIEPLLCKDNHFDQDESDRDSENEDNEDEDEDEDEVDDEENEKVLDDYLASLNSAGKIETKRNPIDDNQHDKGDENGESTNSDLPSMNDEEMFETDEKIAAIFKIKKQELELQKQTKATNRDFKLNLLNVLQSFLSYQLSSLLLGPSNISEAKLVTTVDLNLVLTSLKSLFQIIMSTSFKPVEEKAISILKETAKKLFENTTKVFNERREEMFSKMQSLSYLLLQLALEKALENPSLNQTIHKNLICSALSINPNLFETFILPLLISTAEPSGSLEVKESFAPSNKMIKAFRKSNLQQNIIISALSMPNSKVQKLIDENHLRFCDEVKIVQEKVGNPKKNGYLRILKKLRDKGHPPNKMKN